VTPQVARALRESKLLKASFRATDLSGSEFVNCDLREADFRGASGDQISVFENQMQNAGSRGFRSPDSGEKAPPQSETFAPVAPRSRHRAAHPLAVLAAGHPGRVLTAAAL
jgi:hypothetical protein